MRRWEPPTEHREGNSAAVRGAQQMEMLDHGAQAPDFSLPAIQVGEVTLSANRGKNVLLIFYPKDNTPG